MRRQGRGGECGLHKIHKHGERGGRGKARENDELYPSNSWSNTISSFIRKSIESISMQ